jgi:hypothetical protein
MLYYFFQIDLMLHQCFIILPKYFPKQFLFDFLQGILLFNIN